MTVVASSNETAIQDPGRDPEALAVLRGLQRDVVLTTGRVVAIREIGEQDVASLRSFYEELSAESRYRRFLGPRWTPPEQALQASARQDVHNHIGFVATDNGHVLGVAEYFGLPGGLDAEVSVAVADAHHHEGIGTLLVEDLASMARAAGYRRLVASVLAENAPMLSVFRTVGVGYRSQRDREIVDIQLDLTEEQPLREHAERRDWVSTVASLRPLLRPEHVVVIGASSRANNPGRRILSELEASFGGRLSAVHPSHRRIGQTPAVGHVGELDHVPDLAVIAVPAPRVLRAIDECGRAGVPAAVVVSSGFAEIGPVGVKRQLELLATARRHGMRLLGPNCLGVVSTEQGLVATFVRQRFAPGGIAVAAQSGGVGIAVAAEAQRRDAGISAFVSLGNKADVSGNDVLRWWADDDTTNVVLLYLESFGNPQRFARIARAVSRRKPIIALMGGRSAAGSRGTRSHTAAMTNDASFVDALLDHTGVARVDTLEELVDAGILLDRQSAPAGPRTALVGNAGGPLILCADTADRRGLVVPELSAALRARIAEHIPGAASFVNPVDLGSAASPEEIAAVTREIAASGEVDSCIVVVVDIDDHTADVASNLSRVACGHVPIALAYLGPPQVAEGVAIFPTSERAATAMATAAARSSWLAREAAGDAADTEPPSGRMSLADARRLVRDRVPDHDDDGWLDDQAAFDMLRAAGLDVVPWRIVTSASACAKAAAEVGVPCVVKATVRDLVHKSDAGAVITGVTTQAAASKAYRSLVHRFGPAMSGALVQHQAEPGLELLVGLVRDERFGPMVVVAAGGTNAEILSDRVVLVPPVTSRAARRALDQLRLAPLLHGYRGRTPLDVDGIVDAIRCVSELGVTVPEIAEMDVNPLIVGPTSVTAVDTRVRIAAPPIASPPLRGLSAAPRA